MGNGILGTGKSICKGAEAESSMEEVPGEGQEWRAWVQLCEVGVLAVLRWGEVEGGTWAPGWGWACSEQEPCTLRGSGW